MNPNDFKKEWMDKDYYSILGVKKDSSQDEIKKAYRKLARDLHPDKTKGDKAKEDRFKEVTAAFDVIGKEDTRKKYDQFRQMTGGGAHFTGGSNGGFEDLFGGFGGGFSDIFNMFSGSRSGGNTFSSQFQNFNKRQEPQYTRAQKPKEVVRVPIGFSELIFGTEIKVKAPNGKTYKVKIKPYSKPSQKLAIPNASKDLQDKLYVEFDVIYPENLPLKMKSTLKEFNEWEKEEMDKLRN